MKPLRLLISLALPAVAQKLEDQYAPYPTISSVKSTRDSCPATKPKATGKNWSGNCSTGGQNGPCQIYDPIISNLCLAQEGNQSDHVSFDQVDPRSGRVTSRHVNMSAFEIKYDYFGKSDCRSSNPRKLSAIKRAIIHNGSNAESNFNTWKCRTASSHYTINRDGAIYQHLGEERSAWTVGGPWNNDSIGIELETDGDCSTNDAYVKGKDYLEKYKEVVPLLCGPSAAQYESLTKLLKGIAGRTGASFDVEHVVGHCENGTASDPLAFDWSKIGLSNKDKKAYLKKEADADCRWYNYD